MTDAVVRRVLTGN